MKNELQRIRDNLKCALNMGGLRDSAEWTVGELDRLMGSLPVGVPDGYAIVPVEPTPEMLAEIHLVESFTGTALRARYRAMLAAAPTVKAEQVQCKSCGDFGSDCDECGAKSPSLPAAGSAVEEVEVVAWSYERWVCGAGYSKLALSFDQPYSTDRNVEPLMTVAALHQQAGAQAKELEAARGLLRDADWSMHSSPLCQSGVIERCCCRKCVHSRIDAFLKPETPDHD